MCVLYEPARILLLVFELTDRRRSCFPFISLFCKPTENTEIHAKFCGYTSSLLEVLFGVSATQTTTEPSLLNKMTKEDIVAKTPVTYQKEEIYHLLYSTLLEWVNFSSVPWLLYFNLLHSVFIIKRRLILHLQHYLNIVDKTISVTGWSLQRQL